MVWLHGSLGFLSLPAGEDVSPDSSPLSLFSHILPTAALREEGVEAVKAALRDTMALEDVTDSVSTRNTMIMKLY